MPHARQKKSKIHQDPRFSVASPRSRLPKSRGFRLALTQVLESGVNGTAKGDRKVIVVISIGGHITNYNCVYIYVLNMI